MKKILFVFLIGVSTLLTLDSCKKDDESKSKTDLLTAGSWVQVGATEDGEDVWATDYDACEKDDITTFNADGTYKIDEGATKCDPDDPQISQSGIWKFTSGETKIELDGFEATILTLSSTDLVVSIDIFGSTSTATYKKQ